MAEAFYGKWESTVLENFDEYMKAMEVGFVLRKAGAHSTTYIDISENDGGLRWQYKIAFKSGDLKFKFGEEFTETTPDGRNVKSLVTMKDNKLFWFQTGKPRDTTITRHLEDGGNAMVEICEAADTSIICTRKYKRTG